MPSIQPLGEPEAPPLYRAASEGALKVRVVRGMTAIAERNQVRRLIRSTGGPRNEVMDVGFAPRAGLAARPAGMVVSGKHHSADGVPLLVLPEQQIIDGWVLQPELPDEARHVVTACDQVARPCGARR